MTKKFISIIISIIMCMCMISPVMCTASEEHTEYCKFVCNWSNRYVDMHNIPFASIKCEKKVTFVNTNKYLYTIVANEDFDLFKAYQNANRKNDSKSGPSDVADQVSFKVDISVPVMWENRVQDTLGNGNYNKKPNLYAENYKFLYGVFNCGKEFQKYRYATCYGTKLLENRTYIYKGDVLFSCDIIIDANGFPISDYQSFACVEQNFGSDVVYDISDANINTLEEENKNLKEQISILSSSVYGDVTGDGAVTVEDSMWVLMYYTEHDVALRTQDSFLDWCIKRKSS